MWKRIILWSITILWATGIFCFSAQPATKSAEMSSKIAKTIARSISGDKAPEWKIETLARKIHSVVRKAAHFCMYLGLGVLVLLLCKSYGVRSLRACLLALGCSALYAASDEIHQLFVPGRGCQAFDVLLDSFGAAVGIFSSHFTGLWFQAIIKKK